MSYYDQGRLFTFEDFFTEGDDNHRLLLVLSALEDDALMEKLESERKGRRNRYPVRMLWQSLIAAKVYGIPTTNGLIRELRRNGYVSRHITAVLRCQSLCAYKPPKALYLRGSTSMTTHNGVLSL